MHSVIVVGSAVPLKSILKKKAHNDVNSESQADPQLVLPPRPKFSITKYRRRMRLSLYQSSPFTMINHSPPPTQFDPDLFDSESSELEPSDSEPYDPEPTNTGHSPRPLIYEPEPFEPKSNSVVSPDRLLTIAEYHKQMQRSHAQLKHPSLLPFSRPSPETADEIMRQSMQKAQENLSPGNFLTNPVTYNSIQSSNHISRSNVALLESCRFLEKTNSAQTKQRSSKTCVSTENSHLTRKTGDIQNSKHQTTYRSPSSLPCPSPFPSICATLPVTADEIMSQFVKIAQESLINPANPRINSDKYKSSESSRNDQACKITLLKSEEKHLEETKQVYCAEICVSNRDPRLRTMDALQTFQHQSTCRCPSPSFSSTSSTSDSEHEILHRRTHRPEESSINSAESPLVSEACNSKEGSNISLMSLSALEEMYSAEAKQPCSAEVCFCSRYPGLREMECVTQYLKRIRYSQSRSS